MSTLITLARLFKLGSVMTFSYWSFMHFITSNNDSISRTQEERGETAVTGWPTELGLRDIYEISMNSYHHIM